MLCTLGPTNAFVRFLGGYNAEGNCGVIKGVFSRGLITVLLTSIAVTVVFFYCSAFISNNLFNKPEFESVLWVLAFAIPFFAVYWLVAYPF